MARATAISILRKRGEDSTKVGYAELFFDLVFVLAIIMISHHLVAHLSLIGVYETILLLLAVWWVWIYTTWATNWLNPQSIPVRFVLFFAMLGGLGMAISIPKVFAGSGLLFAISYVSIQVGRTLFIMSAYPKTSIHHKNFKRIAIWFVLSGILWIYGGTQTLEIQLVTWSLAILIEYVGPWFRFWLPNQGSSQTRQWDIDGEHMAERCALFIIIALGETILVMGRTMSELLWTFEIISAFAITFIGTVLLWWIYFNVGVERGSIKIAKSDDPGRIGRLVYTYIHILIIAGIIFVAAADELILVHPHDALNLLSGIVIFGGPLLYLIGNLLFKRTMYGFFPQSHIIGTGLIVLLACFSSFMTLIVAGAGIIVILLGVACLETYAVCTNKL